MGVSKQIREQIVRLMLQDVPTDEIAERVNCSIGTVRITFEELRDELGVSSKVGIARAYLERKLIALSEHMQEILNLLGSCQMTTRPKRMRRMQKKRN